MEQGKTFFSKKNKNQVDRKGIKKRREKSELDNIVEEYSLKQSNFNPSKQSPNVFIRKLEIRMKMYYKDLYNSYNL
tara:strand:- start:249 stop:476 length:228 start_codon:yes stop_codon:yes gene_type:complete